MDSTTDPLKPGLPRVCIEGHESGSMQLLLRMARSEASVAALASAIRKYDGYESRKQLDEHTRDR